MPINVIILPKERLISVDAVIPAIMQLKTEYPQVNVYFVLPSQNHFELLMENHHLTACIDSIKARIIYPRKGNRLTRLFYLLSLLTRFALSTNIIFKAGDIIYKHKIFMTILKKISRTIEIRLLLISTVMGYCKGRVDAWQTISDKSKNKILGKALTEDDDFLLTSLRKEDIDKYYEGGVSPSKYIYTGYIRRFPAWIDFFRETVNAYKSSLPQPYCLFILTTMGKRLNQIEEPPISETFKESLKLMKPFCKRIHTVFRPHPITDMDILKSIIEEVDYENYTIDYAHPAVLSYNAKFITGNGFSNTMYDAYYMKRPVVLYTQYHKTWKDKFEKWPYVDFMCDRNPEKFVKTIEEIIDGEITVSRDQKFLDENFPPPPESFYKFFDKLLAK